MPKASTATKRRASRKNPKAEQDESGDEEYDPNEESGEEEESDEEEESGEEESGEEEEESGEEGRKRKRAVAKELGADAVEGVEAVIKKIKGTPAADHFIRLCTQSILQYLEITGDHVLFKATGQVPDLLKCFDRQAFTTIEQGIGDILLACTNQKLLDLWKLFFYVHSAFCMAWKNYFVDASATGVNGLPLNSSIGGFGRNAAMAVYVEIWELLDQVECLFSGVSASFRMAEAAQLANKYGGFGVDGCRRRLLNKDFRLRKSMMTREEEAAFKNSEENVEFHGRSARAAYRMSGPMQEGQAIMDSIRDSLTFAGVNGHLPEAIAILGEIHYEFVQAQLGDKELFDIAKKEALRVSKSKPTDKASLERLMDGVLDALKEVVGYALDSVSAVSAIMLRRDTNGSLHVPTALDSTDLFVSMQQAVKESVKVGVSVEQHLLALKSIMSGKDAVYGVSLKIGAFAGRVFCEGTLKTHILCDYGTLNYAMGYNIIESQQREKLPGSFPFDGAKEERKRMFMRLNVDSWPKDFFSAEGVQKLEKTYRETYVSRLGNMAGATPEGRKEILREMKLKSLTRSGAFVFPMYTAVRAEGDTIRPSYSSPVEYLKSVRLALAMKRPPPGIVNKMSVVEAFVNSIDMLPPLPILSDKLDTQLRARDRFAKAKEKVLKAMRRRVRAAVNLDAAAASDEEGEGEQEEGEAPHDTEDDGEEGGGAEEEEEEDEE